MFTDILKDYLRELWDLDVVTITAAGNRAFLGGPGEEGLEFLHLTSPHDLGTEQNQLITVGG